MNLSVRRIDLLNVSVNNGGDCIRRILTEIEKKKETVLAQIDETFGGLKQALETRRAEIRSKVENLVDEKISVLKEQDASLSSLDPTTTHRLQADSTLIFQLHEEDHELSAIIPQFGKVTADSTYASESTISGPALFGMREGTSSTVYVQTCDKDGNPRKSGGDVVTARINTAYFKETTSIDLKDGRYAINITSVAMPENSEDANLTIHVNGEEMGGSPYQLTIQPPMDVTALGMDETVLGRESEFGKCELGAFNHPAAVCFDQYGRFVFVVDQSNNRLQIFDAETKGLSSIVGGNTRPSRGRHKFNNPFGVAQNETRLCVSDMLNHRIAVFEWNAKLCKATLLYHIGSEGTEPGQFNLPKGICLRGDTLYVCDSGNDRIQIFELGLLHARHCATFGKRGSETGQLSAPQGIALDNAGDIYVTDGGNNRICVYKGSDNYENTRSWGSPGCRRGQFRFPGAIFITDENIVFVADGGNSRIQVFNTDGEMIHRWGGKLKEAEDGVEEEPLWQGIKNPVGLSVSQKGSVAVADYGTSALYIY